MAAVGELRVDVVIVVEGQAQLLEVVLALGSPGGLAGLLHSGKQQRNQNGNNGNDNQQFNQRKAPTTTV